MICEECGESLNYSNLFQDEVEEKRQGVEILCCSKLWLDDMLCLLCRRGTRLFITSVRGRVIVWFSCCWKETPTPTSEITYVWNHTIHVRTCGGPHLFFFYRTERRRWTSQPDWSSTRSSTCSRRHTDRDSDWETDSLLKRLHLFHSRSPESWSLKQQPCCETYAFILTVPKNLEVQPHANVSLDLFIMTIFKLVTANDYK